MRFALDDPEGDWVVHEGTSDHERSRLRAQLRAVGRLWKMISLFALAGLGLALVFASTQPPTYRVSSDILLSPTTFDVQRGGSSITPEEIVTQVQVVTSRPVAEMVQAELGLAEVPDLQEQVTVEALGSSRVLRVTATSQDAERAADMAEAVATQYLSYRRTNTQTSLSEVTSTLTDRQDQLENRIDILDRALRDGAGSRTGELEAERRNLLSQLGQITAQLAGLDITVSAGAGGDVLNEPQTPDSPIAPQPVLTGALGLLAGLLIGIAAAVLRNRLDEVLHDEESVQESLGTIPILARVPRWKARGHDGLITVSQPDSRSSQAFQGLSTRVRFMLGRLRGDRPGGAVVLCTSAEPSEGKTALAANLAVAAARVGMRVVLVDADLRRDGPERFPGVAHGVPGLSDLLVRVDSISGYLVPGPVKNLMLLPAGASPANPTEMMASARMGSVVAALAERADLVIIDTPPTLSYADSLEMANVADLILLVTQMGKSRITAVEHVAERLLQVGGSAVGAVILDGTSHQAAGGPNQQLPQPKHTRRADVVAKPTSQETPSR
jgi:capsular exopolysaccharide synthesis family protein